MKLARLRSPKGYSHWSAKVSADLRISSQSVPFATRRVDGSLQPTLTGLTTPTRLMARRLRW